jgi:hypothetical protein
VLKGEYFGTAFEDIQQSHGTLAGLVKKHIEWQLKLFLSD